MKFKSYNAEEISLDDFIEKAYKAKLTDECQFTYIFEKGNHNTELQIIKSTKDNVRIKSYYQIPIDDAGSTLSSGTQLFLIKPSKVYLKSCINNLTGK